MKCKYCKGETKFLYKIKITKIEEKDPEIIKENPKASRYMSSEVVTYKDENNHTWHRLPPVCVDKEIYIRECCRDCIPKLVTPIIVASEL